MRNFKPYEIRDAVTELMYVANNYRDTRQLREKIMEIVLTLFEVDTLPQVLQEPDRIEFRINANEYWTVVPASMSELPEFIAKMPGCEIRYLYAHSDPQVLPKTMRGAQP